MAGRTESRKAPLPNVAPWLVIPYGKGKKNQAFYSLCESNNKTCQKVIPELSGKTFFQKPCHQGWLVIVCEDKKVRYTPTWNYGDCFLWNPATLETIKLPNILSSGYAFNRYVLVDCILSSPPRIATTSTNVGDGNDSMVLFLFQRNNDEYEYVFLFSRPGDKQWRTQEFTRELHYTGDNSILSLHYLKGNFYAMTSSDVCHFKIELEQSDSDNVSISVRLIETSSDLFFPWIGGNYISITNQYVQTCDDLYRLELYKTDDGEEVISINVARLDFSLMEWKEVSSFGDLVLFSGKSTTACCSAAELGINRGCWYYTLPKDQSLYKYELEGTGTVTLPCLELPTPWFSPDWIMMSTTYRDGDRQDRTKFMIDKCEKKDCSIDHGVIRTSSANNNKEYQGQVYEEVKLQTPWSILDKDSVHMIASYLHPLDYKLFRLVCKANRLNLPIVKQASCVSPWLVFSTTNDCTVYYNIIDPMHDNENYFMERAFLRGATIRFQKGGWLLMSEGAQKLFFYNPFTKETIQLPDLPERYIFSNISFSSLPTCSDCVVYGIRESDNQECGIRVYIIARGEKSWRYQEFGNIDTDEYYMLVPNTPVLYKGILYIVDYNGLLGAFSLEDGLSWSYKVLEKPYGIFDRAYPSFLVECGGDLLLVKLGQIGTLIGIFKMDFSKMEWVRVKSLGRHTLFISYTSCVSRMALCTDMENKIYFPRLSLHGEGILFYSLDTRCYHSLGNERSSKDFYDTKSWSSWFWIEPNWSRSTTQELDWFVTFS